MGFILKAWRAAFLMLAGLAVVAFAAHASPLPADGGCMEYTAEHDFSDPDGLESAIAQAPRRPPGGPGRPGSRHEPRPDPGKSRQPAPPPRHEPRPPAPRPAPRPEPRPPAPPPRVVVPVPIPVPVPRPVPRHGPASITAPADAPMISGSQQNAGSAVLRIG